MAASRVLLFSARYSIVMGRHDDYIAHNQTNPKQRQERQEYWVVSADRIRIEHNLADESLTVGDQTLMKPRKAYKEFAHHILAHSDS